MVCCGVLCSTYILFLLFSDCAFSFSPSPYHFPSIAFRQPAAHPPSRIKRNEQGRSSPSENILRNSGIRKTKNSYSLINFFIFSALSKLVYAVHYSIIQIVPSLYPPLTSLPSGPHCNPSLPPSLPSVLPPSPPVPVLF